MTERRRRKPFDVFVAVVSIAAAVWVSYWYVANQLSFAAMRYVMAGIGDGAECSSLTSAGFPLELAVGCTGFRSAKSKEGSSLAIGGASVAAPLYWPLTLRASLAAPISVKPGGGPELTMTWKAASTDVSAGLGGVIRASGSAQAVKLAGPIHLSHLVLSGIATDLAEVALTPAKTPDYKLSVRVAGVRPEAADKRDLPVVALDGQAALIGVGRTLGFDPRRTLRTWTKRGGALKLDHLAFSAGPVTASGSGDLTLSPEGVLSGKLVVRFVKLEELPAVIEALQPGSRTAAAVARLLLAVTRKVDTESGPARQTTLNLGGGFVSVGIVPIAAIPPIRF
ncbi:MAG: DUF2125 domain-containing protein [Bauldia sp.]